MIFIDLRDHFGITQCVVDQSNPFFKVVEDLKVESVITIVGKVIARSTDTINNELQTGLIEVDIESIIIENNSKVLPFLVLFGPL